MKLIFYILIPVFLVAVFVPCSDQQVTGVSEKSEFAHSHNHDEESKDGCSPICVCTCCGISVTAEAIDLVKLEPEFTFSDKIHSFYKVSRPNPPVDKITHPPIS